VSSQFSSCLFVPFTCHSVFRSIRVFSRRHSKANEANSRIEIAVYYQDTLKDHLVGQAVVEAREGIKRCCEITAF
jgi:hypothetical protein